VPVQAMVQAMLRPGCHPALLLLHWRPLTITQTNYQSTVPAEVPTQGRMPRLIIMRRSAGSRSSSSRRRSSGSSGRSSSSRHSSVGGGGGSSSSSWRCGGDGVGTPPHYTHPLYTPYSPTVTAGTPSGGAPSWSRCCRCLCSHRSDTWSSATHSPPRRYYILHTLAFTYCIDCNPLPPTQIHPSMYGPEQHEVSVQCVLAA
jgi:hypothetical protein